MRANCSSSGTSTTSPARRLRDNSTITVAVSETTPSVITLS